MQGHVPFSIKTEFYDHIHIHFHRCEFENTLKKNNIPEKITRKYIKKYNSKYLGHATKCFGFKRCAYTYSIQFIWAWTQLQCSYLLWHTRFKRLLWLLGSGYSCILCCCCFFACVIKHGLVNHTSERKERVSFEHLPDETLL